VTVQWTEGERAAVTAQLDGMERKIDAGTLSEWGAGYLDGLAEGLTGSATEPALRQRAVQLAARIERSR
jgi:hypothetical protein